MSKKIDQIIESYPDETFKCMDEFDDAIIGVFGNEWNNEKPPVLAFSKGKIIEILMKDMSYDDAMEHFDFNIIGKDTPIFIDDMHEFEYPDHFFTEDEETDDNELKFPLMTVPEVHLVKNEDLIGLHSDIQKELNKE
jgi:hypothetical protein